MADESDGDAKRYRVEPYEDGPEWIVTGPRITVAPGHVRMDSLYLDAEEAEHIASCMDYARDAALCEARAEIENLQSDAANDLCHMRSMEESERQVYEIIGIKRGQDNWDEFLERLRVQLARISVHNAALAEVVQAARKILSIGDGVALMDGLPRRMRNALVELRKALVHLDSAPADEGWRPIETAPKDGTLLDLWAYEPGMPGCRIADARWHPSDDRWINKRLFPLRKTAVVTHWRPLPAPPPAPREEGEG